MRPDPARYWRIGFDPLDTLKGVGDALRIGTLQSHSQRSRPQPPFYPPPRFQVLQGFEDGTERGSDDIGWQYGIMALCWKIGTTSSAIIVVLRDKEKHLAGGRLVGYHDVQGCKSVLREVKKLMIEHLKQVRAEIARKKADKEIQERIISGRERDEDVDDEVEMYAEYVPDPDVQERLARAHSRAEAWEGDQRAAHRVSFQGTQHELGSGSGSAVGGSGSRRFSNVGDYFTRPPPTQTQVPEQGRHNKRPTCVQIEDVDPYVYPRDHGKQTRIDDAYN
ncbi:hypothetical protein Taro_007703 [Colocasia esculenta]|uniref:Uncharacterized protein n=1 Tax=Colocasia esculenta TaxID=4460 RepID=A0A843TVP3_COLES|nr:hypothetical protein [Colocasia esculenta]